ncbi:RNA polymerase sigma factor [Aquibacillus rhizosphaerae]|uniref:Sigma-70 family RNA polymerase sigma factor n=1 Tax=Aquibacillus rhizosphaerae TaxID=3051431 RepID=A0ABT7L8U4_9BACI|nr:sigma-70 family RNA polymerase sigma factor [Aquibacillus sp. LR5S19]MDL4841789.1 sigma-70 family RNA polymerase sigma factor [Aquibacillus sp. LR5S19]
MVDYNLITQAKEGCDEAFAKIFDQFSPIVRRYALSIRFPYDDIPDLVQEVFVKVYRFINQVDETTFYVWLYRITLNTARDMGRKQLVWQNKFTLLIKDPNQLLGFSSNIEKDLVNKMESEQLIACIKELDEKYRLPLILHFFYFVKYDEIAHLLGVKASTIKVRVFRAKKQIADKINNIEELESVIN